MKAFIPGILALAVVVDGTFASPSLFHSSKKKDLNKTDPYTLPKDWKFFGANVSLRKPQFEKYDVCKRWLSGWRSNFFCTTLFPQLCGKQYCAKTKQDCRKVSESETYFFCDIFESPAERNETIDRFTIFPPHTGVNNGDYYYNEAEKLGIETVAAGLCSGVSETPLNCSGAFPTLCSPYVPKYEDDGYLYQYCAKSEQACELKKRITMGNLVRYRSFQPVRAYTKPCDTFLPLSTSPLHEEKTENVV